MGKLNFPGGMRAWIPTQRTMCGRALMEVVVAVGPSLQCSTAKVGGEEFRPHAQVIGPFQFMPRGVLEGSGNAVLRTLVGTLLPVFVRRCRHVR